MGGRESLFPFLRRWLHRLDRKLFYDNFRPYAGPPVAPTRPLNVLGREGWLRWELIHSAPGRRSYRLDFNGETHELEDFGEV